MTSATERVANVLAKLKSISEVPESLGERDRLVKQLKSDLTHF